MNIWLAIFIGGGLGSLSRFGVTKLVLSQWAGKFPMGTLAANILSCIVMGLVMGMFAHKITSPELRALILVGFCGGFSTFSTFSLETFQLMETGHYYVALANVLISIFTCVLVLWLLIR